jgi:hypothetical protein
VNVAACAAAEIEPEGHELTVQKNQSSRPALGRRRTLSCAKLGLERAVEAWPAGSVKSVELNRYAVVL